MSPRSIDVSFMPGHLKMKRERERKEVLSVTVMMDRDGNRMEGSDTMTQLDPIDQDHTTNTHSMCAMSVQDRPLLCLCFK